MWKPLRTNTTSCLDVLSNQIVGARAFPRIVLHSGFQQTKSHPCDISKTTPSQRYGLYNYFVSSSSRKWSAYFMYSMNWVSCLSLTRSSWFSLTTSLVIQRISKIMLRTCTLFSSNLETLSSMLIFSKDKFWLDRVKFLGYRSPAKA